MLEIKFSLRHEPKSKARLFEKLLNLIVKIARYLK